MLRMAKGTGAAIDETGGCPLPRKEKGRKATNRACAGDENGMTGHARSINEITLIIEMSLINGFCQAPRRAILRA